jgi:uncharacterized ParB-like nuclease family protein
MSEIFIPEAEVRDVHLSEIDRTFPAQLRAQEDERAVDDYAQAMERGEEFPMPLLVTGEGGYVTVDGHHRIRAYEKAGREKFKAKVIPTPPGVDAAEFARLLGTRFNNQHGVRKTRKDKRNEALAVIPLMHRIGMSNRQMAQALKCDEKTIRNLKADLADSLSAGADNALRAAVLHDFMMPADGEAGAAAEEQAPMALNEDRDEPVLPALPRSLPQELQRRVFQNKQRLGVSEGQALQVFMAAAALLARMDEGDACAVANALYAIQARKSA